MNDNEVISTALINVSKLEQRYEVVLTQYQEALQNYIQDLQIPEQERNDNFVKLSGRAYWGTGRLTQGAVATETECESMCASNSSCTGATFNPSYPYCWTRTGDSILTAGNDDDIAIIPSRKASSLNLKSLNKQLLELNNEIMNEMEIASPQTNALEDSKNAKNEELLIYYNNLVEQKIVIDNQIREYDSIVENNIEETLYVQREYMTYTFWLIIVIIMAIILCCLFLGYDTLGLWTIVLLTSLLIYLLDMSMYITYIYNQIVNIYSYIFNIKIV